jgi:hypothetical protein
VNVVRSALSFHMICDWGTKPLPFMISRTDSASPGIVSGKSEAIWGCGTAGTAAEINDRGTGGPTSPHG